METIQPFSVEDVIAKFNSGAPLSPFEMSVYRINVRLDGSRYSADAKVRDRQYLEDCRAERAARGAKGGRS